LQIWNCRDGSGKIFEDLGHIEDIRFSPDGQYIAGALNSGDVLIWHVRKGQLLEKLIGHREWVNSIAFTPDGMGLVSGSFDRTVTGLDHSRTILERSASISFIKYVAFAFLSTYPYLFLLLA